MSQVSIPTKCIDHAEFATTPRPFRSKLVFSALLVVAAISVLLVGAGKHVSQDGTSSVFRSRLRPGGRRRLFGLKWSTKQFHMCPTGITLCIRDEQRKRREQKDLKLAREHERAERERIVAAEETALRAEREAENLLTGQARMAEDAEDSIVASTFFNNFMRERTGKKSVEAERADRQMKQKLKEGQARKKQEQITAKNTWEREVREKRAAEAAAQLLEGPSVYGNLRSAVHLQSVSTGHGGAGISHSPSRHGKIKGGKEAKQSSRELEREQMLAWLEENGFTKQKDSRL